MALGAGIAIGLLALTALTLLSMDREAICACGTVKLWHGEVTSSENSQHLTDWYTPSHIIHGILFYSLLHLANRLPRVRLGLGARFAVATAVECAWEIAENTDAVIERYREATIALDYYGDSVLNSVSDIGAMWFGFWIARKAPVWFSVLLVLVLEAVVVTFIRDGLALNVLMLLWPVDAVRDWQSGA